MLKQLHKRVCVLPNLRILAALYWRGITHYEGVVPELHICVATRGQDWEMFVLPSHLHSNCLIENLDKLELNNVSAHCCSAVTSCRLADIQNREDFFSPMVVCPSQLVTINISYLTQNLVLPTWQTNLTQYDNIDVPTRIRCCLDQIKHEGEMVE